jgi:hypothetical protein
LKGSEVELGGYGAHWISKRSWVRFSLNTKDLVTNNFPFWGGLASSLQGTPSAVWLATSARGNAAGCLPGDPKTGSY